MAQPSLLAKTPETDAAPSLTLPSTAFAAPSDVAPIIVREATPADTRKALLQPRAGVAANPVADVQAKLRAALNGAPAKPSVAAEIFFKTLMTIACVATTVLGLTIGVACVFLGTAIYLFPVTAGLSLAAVVIGSGYLAYRLYTGSSKECAARRPAIKAGDMFEPLSAGRFNAA